MGGWNIIHSSDCNWHQPEKSHIERLINHDPRKTLENYVLQTLGIAVFGGLFLPYFGAWITQVKTHCKDIEILVKGLYRSYHFH